MMMLPFIWGDFEFHEETTVVIRNYSVHMYLAFIFTGASLFYICILAAITVDVLSATVGKPTYSPRLHFSFSES